VMIIGRLTREPELKTIPNGTPVATFSVATNRVYKDKSGNRQETVEYHEVVTWRRLAEIAAQYLKRGTKVYIEGRMQTRSWDDPNGFKRYKTEIVADNMIMLDRPAGAGGAVNAAVSPVVASPYSPARPTVNKAVGMATTPIAASNAPYVPPTKSGEEDIPTIDISEENYEEAEVSVEDIPF